VDNVTSLGLARQDGRTSAARTQQPALAMRADSRSPVAEAYRTLAANLQFAGSDVQTVGITSPGAGEGKSTTIANLGIALAENGRRVVLVDADLRRPSLHDLFGLPNREGLANLLVSEHATLPLQETGTPGLRLLASGPLPPNPLEVLGSRRLEHVLSQVRAQADVVLVDTPPAAVLADAALLAPRLDGVLLVVSAGHTRRDLAKRAKEQLERTGSNVLGVVLINVRESGKLYQY
jgi:capsular exopolysaccharide synthesis family protein